MENLETLIKIVGAVFSALLIIAVAAAVITSYFKRAFRDQWRDVAESRLGMIETLKLENAELAGEIAQHVQHLNECRELRDEFAKFNLRLQAREQSYQTCINRLEMRLGIPPTDFDPIPKTLN